MVRFGDSIRVRVRVAANIDVGARLSVSITGCVGARVRVTSYVRIKGSVMAGARIMF